MKFTAFEKHCTSPFTRTAPCHITAIAAILFVFSGTGQAQQLAVNSATSSPSSQTLRIPSAQLATIKKPAHIKGQPASTGLPKASPEFGSLDDMENWLLNNRRATWRYFDRLDSEKREQLLAQYQKFPDTELLSENVLRTYWKTRR